MKNPAFRKAWNKLHTPKGQAEFHGDQLYSWFREHFKGHPKALTRKECRAMFLMACEAVLERPA